MLHHLLLLLLKPSLVFRFEAPEQTERQTNIETDRQTN